jgi:hypothetical protein
MALTKSVAECSPAGRGSSDFHIRRRCQRTSAMDGDFVRGGLRGFSITCD